jgi:hypothetical protein
LHLDEPVALAHIDADWYESVRTCLQRLARRARLHVVRRSDTPLPVV